MDWKTMLAYISGSVDEELLLRKEYLVAENRILRNQIPGRLRLTDGERRSLAEIGKRLGRVWGYDRIAGAMANLGYRVSDQTVGNILKRHGVPPAPERRKTTTWSEFIRSYMDVLAATDFFTAEVWTKSVREECLSKLILFGERLLRHALKAYVAHHHHERNHQGKDNLLLFPAAEASHQSKGTVRSRERLGGLLRFYHREAA